MSQKKEAQCNELLYHHLLFFLFWDRSKLNCNLKVRQKKSNFWDVFIMKFTYEDKVQIYELRKQGQSFNQLSKKFGVDVSVIRYMMRLIERYGIEVVRKREES